MFIRDWYIDSYTIRRLLLVAGGAVLLLVAGIYLATGKDPVTPIVRASQQTPCRAYAVDVGGSTARQGDASLRGLYLGYMHRELQRAANDKAQLYVGYFAGQPPQELTPYRFDQASSNGFDASISRSEKIAEAQRTLTSQLTSPATLTNGSAVIATIGTMAESTPAGCDLTVVSDGIENSELGSFGVGGATKLLAAGAVDAELSKVQAEGAIPNLRGRRLAMPYLVKTAGTGPQVKYGPERRRNATRAFWEGYARRANTELLSTAA